MASVTFTFNDTTMDKVLAGMAELLKEHRFAGGVMASVIDLGGGAWQVDVSHTDPVLEAKDAPSFEAGI